MNNDDSRPAPLTGAERSRRSRARKGAAARPGPETTNACGSWQAYRQHVRAHDLDRPCMAQGGECRDAWLAYCRAGYAARKAATKAVDDWGTPPDDYTEFPDEIDGDQ